MAPILATRGAGSALGFGRLAGISFLESFDSISSVYLSSSSSSSIEFTSIPSTYKHLQIRMSSRITSGAQFLLMEINGDTTATNYNYHVVEGDGSTVSSSGAASAFCRIGATRNGTNNFGVGIVHILDYANTSKFKTVRSIAGVDDRGVGGAIMMASSLWESTSAITSLKIYGNFSSTLAQYSRFDLYGIGSV